MRSADSTPSPFLCLHITWRFTSCDRRSWGWGGFLQTERGGGEGGCRLRHAEGASRSFSEPVRLGIACPTGRRSVLDPIFAGGPPLSTGELAYARTRARGFLFLSVNSPGFFCADPCGQGTSFEPGRAGRSGFSEAPLQTDRIVLTTFAMTLATATQQRQNVRRSGRTDNRRRPKHTAGGNKGERREPQERQAV